MNTKKSRKEVKYHLSENFKKAHKIIPSKKFRLRQLIRYGLTYYPEYRMNGGWIYVIDKNTNILKTVYNSRLDKRKFEWAWKKK